MAKAACSSSQPMRKLCAARFHGSLTTLLLRTEWEKTGDTASSRTFRPQRWWERCCVCMKKALPDLTPGLCETYRRACLDETLLQKRTKRRTAFSPCGASDPL